MNDLVLGLIVGVVVTALLMGLVLWMNARRLRRRHVDELKSYDESIIDLRQERAQDKEINRRLRRDLVTNSPDRLIDTAAVAEQERDTAISERDHAIEQLGLIQRDLSLANGRLSDREAKLREYREALKEIRLSLEEQDRARAAAVNVADTGEVPVQAILDIEAAQAVDVGVFADEPETADASASE